MALLLGDLPSGRDHQDNGETAKPSSQRIIRRTSGVPRLARDHVAFGCTRTAAGAGELADGPGWRGHFLERPPRVAGAKTGWPQAPHRRISAFRARVPVSSSCPGGLRHWDVYAMTGGFSSARFRRAGPSRPQAKAAEARHKMCAPVARKARARDQDKNFRSASTSIPGPRHPSRSRASGCSAAGIGPRPPRAGSRSPTRPPPPTGPAGTRPPGTGSTAARRTRRSCRCPARPSWTRHRHDPQPAAEDTRCPVRARRPRHLLEQHPHRVRAELAAPAGQRGDVRLPPSPPAPRPPSRPGPATPASRSAPRRWWYRPSASLAITCPYPQFRPRNSHSASTKYTISRAGSSRRRCSRVPVTSMTSSTSSGGNALVSTPTEIRSGSQPSGDRPSEPS